MQRQVPQTLLRNAAGNGSNEILKWQGKKAGDRFWASITITPVTQSNILFYTVIVRNLQARKEAEEKNLRWQSVFEHAGWGVVIADPSTNKLLMMNPAFAHMHGYTVDELTGRSIDTVFSKDALPQLFRDIQLVHEKGNHSFKSKHVRKDGSFFPVLIDAAAVRDESGRLLYRAVNVRDISDMEQAERVLQESREKYMELIELASDGIFIADLEGRYTQVNSAACRMLGYSRQELIGKTIADIIPPEDIPRLWAAKELLMKPGQVQIEEWRLKKKDGSYLPVEVSAAILPDGRWQGFVRDISRRKAALEALSRSEEKFRRLVENAHDAVLIFDPDGRVEFANNKVKDMFGYEPSELKGKTPEFMMPERFAQRHVQHRLNYMKDPVPRTMGSHIDLIGKRKDGTEFPLDISLTPHETKDGTFVTLFIRDSTAQKQFGLQQRFVAETSRILTETMDYKDRVQRIAECVVPYVADWCVVLLVEDNAFHAKAVAHANKEKESLLRNMIDFLPELCAVPLTGDPSADLVDSVVTELTEEEMCNRLCAPSHKQTLRKLESTAIISVPLIARGKVIGELFLGMSESGRRFNASDKSFTLLLAARFAMAVDNARLYLDAQNAVHARENILSIVSHDLKNPITVIKNSSVLLESLIPVANREKLQKLIAAVERSVTHMERLVADLMDFSKIEAGTFRLHVQQVNLNNILEDISRQFLPLAERASISLVIPHATDTITCDPDRIRQVLSNIIGNAIKFTPRSGSVTIGIKEQEEGLIFSVSDTGPGISKENIVHVFDRFWQEAKTAHMGTGLGLFIAKRIVEEHKGRIWVESEQGKGTCFYFYIPVH